MIIGCDTGFFIQLLMGHSTADFYWKKITEDQVKAVVNVLSLVELCALSEKQHIDENTLFTLQSAIHSTCSIDTISPHENFSQSGTWMRDFGCSLTQAAISLTFQKNGVTTVLTTDPSFKAFSFLSSEVILL